MSIKQKFDLLEQSPIHQNESVIEGVGSYLFVLKVRKMKFTLANSCQFVPNSSLLLTLPH